MSTTRFRPLILALAALPLAMTLPAEASQRNQAPERATFPSMLADCQVEKPTELFEVERVVDGDTIYVRRNGKREKLRLLSVDTEEKYMGGGNAGTSKPSTRYGEQSTGWANGFFVPRTPDEGPVQVGLTFPGGVESRDPYGRLLCHVVTSEGIDFNLLLVRTGQSPYFDKYGSSRINHEGFIAAQKLARAERIGIWDDRTNEGGEKRPYAKLVPWWRARAQAVDAFRAEAAKAPLDYVACDEPDALDAAAAGGPRKVTVLALVDRFFEEDDGSRTVLLRGGDKKRSIRVRIAPDQRKAMEAVNLEGTKDEFTQNYLRVSGTLQKGRRGYDLVGVKPADWQPAGPAPGR